MKCLALNHSREHSSYNRLCHLMYYFSFFFFFSSLVVATRNHNNPWRQHPNGSSAGGGVAGAGSARRGLLRRSKCHKDGEEEHNTAHSGCCFLLIGSIHQRIYKACYLNAIFFYPNGNTIHKYSCTSSTYQSPIRC